MSKKRSGKRNIEPVLRVVNDARQKPFWEVRAAANSNEGELLIYGPIFSEAFFEDEVSPAAIREALDDLGDIDTLNVYINSPGGNVFAGNAIYNILKRHSAQIVVYVDGLAASAASVVAMAGDRIIMPVNSMLMIHDAWTIAIGNAAEFRKTADVLDQIGKSLVAAYQARTGMSAEEIAQLMADETWMTAEEAVEMGFADEVEEDQAVAASIEGSQLTVNGLVCDLSMFRHPPKAFLPTGDPPKTEPELKKEQPKPEESPPTRRVFDYAKRVSVREKSRRRSQ